MHIHRYLLGIRDPRRRRVTTLPAPIGTGDRPISVPRHTRDASTIEWPTAALDDTPVARRHDRQPSKLEDRQIARTRERIVDRIREWDPGRPRLCEPALWRTIAIGASDVRFRQLSSSACVYSSIRTPTDESPSGHPKCRHASESPPRRWPRSTATPSDHTEHTSRTPPFNLTPDPRPRRHGRCRALDHPNRRGGQIRVHRGVQLLRGIQVRMFFITASNGPPSVNPAALGGDQTTDEIAHELDNRGTRDPIGAGDCVRPGVLDFMRDPE